MGFIFWCMLTAMWLLDMQCYIYAENAVILSTEISSRIIKFYLFPFLISCGTDFAPHIKLVNIASWQYIIWKPSSSSLSVWSLSFSNFSCFLACTAELYLSIHPTFLNFSLLLQYFSFYCWNFVLALVWPCSLLNFLHHSFCFSSL